MKIGGWHENIKRVEDFVWENQQEVDGEEENYISNIAEELELSTDAVKRAINSLVALGVATCFSVGNKKCVRITIPLDEHRKDPKYLNHV